MRLLAISDLHLGNTANRDALAALPSFPHDWLIIAGDVVEGLDQLNMAFAELVRRFRKVIWTPGNHELWSIPSGTKDNLLRGEERYLAMVDLARSWGIVTPEDPYPLWTGPGGDCVIAPLFLLYDYSFRPDTVSREDVLSWAAETQNVCADEMLLDPYPYRSREDWCHDRCQRTFNRLSRLDPALPTVLVNHYPLRKDLIYIPRVPRFTPWCGTEITTHWHRKFRAKVVVSGHLHVRRTDWRDGTRFEEVSLGNAYQWDHHLGIGHYLREIFPGPDKPPTAGAGAGNLGAVFG